MLTSRGENLGKNKRYDQLVYFKIIEFSFFYGSDTIFCRVLNKTELFSIFLPLHKKTPDLTAYSLVVVFDWIILI